MRAYLTALPESAEQLHAPSRAAASAAVSPAPLRKYRTPATGWLAAPAGTLRLFDSAMPCTYTYSLLHSLSRSNLDANALLTRDDRAATFAHQPVAPRMGLQPPHGAYL